MEAEKTLPFLSVSQETNNELVGNKQLTILGYRYLAAVGTVPTLLCPILPYRYYAVLKIEEMKKFQDFYDFYFALSCYRNRKQDNYPVSRD
jgi:hypothetical protein